MYFKLISFKRVKVSFIFFFLGMLCRTVASSAYTIIETGFDTKLLWRLNG